LFRAPFRELLARDRKTVLNGEIAEPDLLGGGVRFGGASHR
jgi:hypothetical protein